MVPWARLPALHVVATFLQGWARYSCNHVYGCMAYFLIAVDRQDTMSVMTLQAMSSGGRMTQIPLTVNAMCPSHGPVVQASLTELLRSYQYVSLHWFVAWPHLGYDSICWMYTGQPNFA